MVPGARSKFGAPMFETEVFRKQMYCTEESTCGIVGTFRRPLQWFGAPIVTRRPGNRGPLAPRYAPARRLVEPNQRSVPNQCSNIRSFSGPSLSAHAKFDRPRYPKPRVLARAGQEQATKIATYCSELIFQER